MADLSAPKDARPQDADLILMAMVAVAATDGALEPLEIGLIQQIYQDQSGRALAGEEIAAAVRGRDGGLLATLAAAADGLDNDTKEEIIRASYLVLLADDRVADLLERIRAHATHVKRSLDDAELRVLYQGSLTHARQAA